MNKREGMFLALGIILGLAFRPLSQVRGQAESARTLGHLQSQEAKISTMDWLLMRTELSALEGTVRCDAGRPATPAIPSYDSQHDRIVAKYVVNPAWYARAKVSELRSALDERAGMFCGLAMGTFAGQVGFPALSNIARN